MAEFAQNWSAEVLAATPLIAPARQFTYPRRVAGEEDALGRGALLLMVKPAGGAQFMATCARGFADAAMPTGVFACPNPDELCAVAGGYAYLIDGNRPEECRQVEMRPVVEVRALVEHGLLLFVGFHELLAWGSDGLRWKTARLTDEGLRITAIEDGVVRGFGWRVMTDREVEFAVDLKTGMVR